MQLCLTQPGSEHSFRTDQVQSFQLTLQQLCFGLVQGGVQHRAFHQPALQTRALSTALTLTSLSLALDAWLKTSSKRAWKRSPLRKSLCTTSLSTRSSQTALATSSTTTATSSLRRALLSLVWFSFLLNNFFLSNSFWKTEVDEHNELSQNVWDQELEELQVDESFPLDHLSWSSWKRKSLVRSTSTKQLHREEQEQQAWSQSAFEKTKFQTENLEELRQLHLHQLCLQDPDSTISRQLPEESLSSTCLSDSSLDPAASLSDNLSFSKQKLSGQDLSNNSFHKFFPENFGQQLPEKQLQQNLSTDQQPLQETNLTQTNFQQLSLEHPSFHRDDLWTMSLQQTLPRRA